MIFLYKQNFTVKKLTDYTEIWVLKIMADKNERKVAKLT